MKRKNFLACIENSVGTRMFRTYYDANGKDVMDNGNLSCAYYVSSILHLFGLIDRPHFTVKGTEFSMKNIGWYVITKPKKGCVVIWDPILQNGNVHFHIGFYIGDGQAISNRSSLEAVGEHSLHYSGLDKEGLKREATISKLYWHKDLD